MNLKYLTKNIGGRLSGSVHAETAVQWAKKTMLESGADTVYLQEMMVPHWVRGEKEFAKIIKNQEPGFQEVSVCALGGSIGTGTQGITASVIEVRNFNELSSLGRKVVEGKIVFFNRPMDPTEFSTFNAYGGAVNQRGSGASEASILGAVAVVVRSMTLSNDDFPHTGGMGYREGVNKIPACAISTKGADLLSKALKDDPNLKFHLKMNCETLPDVKSYNVVGEIKGTDPNNQIIAVGGHLDSWDLGEGAHDDGAGVVQSIEILRLIKALGIKPKYTIRAIAFMNEENGVRGGKKYAELSKIKNEKHIAAIESDAGGFTPRGFTIEGTQANYKALQKWRPLLSPYGLNDITQGGGGVDISPLRDQQVPLIDFIPDSQRYFDYHHAAIDIFENVNKRELELGTASMMSLIYLLCEYGL